MEEWNNISRTEQDANLMAPLNWAYIGDCVYELYIRTQLVNKHDYKPHKLHIESVKYVKAQAQAEFLQSIMVKLTDEEKDIVRRARNAENHQSPDRSKLKSERKLGNREHEILRCRDGP